MVVASIGKRPTGRHAAHHDLRDPIQILREEKLITVRDIASALSTLGRPWTMLQARRWLQRSGIGFQLIQRKPSRKNGQRGGAWFTSRARLRKTFPDIMDLIEQDKLDRVDRDDDDE